ncbi:MAG: bifunctional enoyl-CoA hydratase/phosphate acetyltransferase [Anaerolineae bacterium]
MAIHNFDQLLAAAKERGPKRVAIATADQKEILIAAVKAYEESLARCTLIADEDAIRRLAAEESLSLEDMEIIHEPNLRQAAKRAVELVNSGQADLIMNGRAQAGNLFRAALDRETGIRTGRLLTDVAVFEIPGVDRLIFISDAGVVVSPTFEQKVEIVQNAIDVAHLLGVENPKVAILSATEMVNPKIPVSLDASNLSKMAERGQIKGGIVDGPLALDNAISLEAAHIKGIHSEVAGRADILIAPDIEAGNILTSSLIYLARAQMASVVVGGRCPLIVPASADPPRSKLVSLALGVFLVGKI